MNICKELVPIIPSIAKERKRVIPWGEVNSAGDYQARGREAHPPKEREGLLVILVHDY